MIKTLLSLALVTCITQAEASEIKGRAKAVDSTTIEINDQRIMLFGVDSVMRKQTCTMDGKIWQCWNAAVHDLQSLLDQGPADCETVGDPDPYGRLLGRCSVSGQSVNEQLVSRGFAVARLAESKDYVAAENAAKDKKLGLWQGQFRQPSEFRRGAGIMVDRP